MILSTLLKKTGVRHGFGELRDDLPENIITPQQVHGNKILVVETGQESGEFDIVVTKTTYPIGIKTADCQSLLVVEPEAGIVAVIHAGWKGTLLRATEVGIRKIREMGGKVENIKAALGPSMLKSCYEVEWDVASQFQKEFPDWPEILEKKSKRNLKPKWFLDVALTNKKQLLKIGVLPQNIDHLEYCTHCHPDRFHSFRRDGEKSGRMVNWIQKSC